ncbi:MAG: PAS domain S-box protein [Methanosarcinales archaeon]|nr:PAS domain S-box protein [Methanosarcinales archaeon]
MNGDKLKAILENIADGIVFVNAENRVEFVNEYGMSMLGLTEDVTGNDVLSCHPESLNETVMGVIEGFRSGSDEAVTTRLDGAGRTMDVTITGVRPDGGYIGTLMTLRDVTVAARREEELTMLANQLKASQEELSTPVVQLWDQVLALPLIGSIDSRRAQTVTEVLLERIVETQSAVVILDITGVRSVDTHVTSNLLNIVSASRLLGAECVLTGINPDVAQTMIHLGTELGDITTMADMQEGLKYAMKRLKGKI